MSVINISSNQKQKDTLDLKRKTMEKEMFVSKLSRASVIERLCGLYIANYRPLNLPVDPPEEEIEEIPDFLKFPEIPNIRRNRDE